MSPLQPTESQLINRPLNQGNSVSRHLRWKLGPGAVVFKQHPKPHQDAGRDRGGDRRAAPDHQRIEQTTWGVKLVERKNGWFVVLSKGTLDYPP